MALLQNNCDLHNEQNYYIIEDLFTVVKARAYDYDKSCFFMVVSFLLQQQGRRLLRPLCHTIRNVSREPCLIISEM